MSSASKARPPQLVPAVSRAVRGRAGWANGDFDDEDGGYDSEGDGRYFNHSSKTAC